MKINNNTISKQIINELKVYVSNLSNNLMPCKYCDIIPSISFDDAFDNYLFSGDDVYKYDWAVIIKPNCNCHKPIYITFSSDFTDEARLKRFNSILTSTINWWVDINVDVTTIIDEVDK